MRNLLFILFITVSASACKKDGVTANVPQASFSTNIVAGSEPSEKDLIQFTNTTTGECTYFWDFGNGNTSTELHPAIAYNVHGIYDVTLTVTDKKGNSTSYTQYVTVLCKFKNKNHVAAEEL